MRFSFFLLLPLLVLLSSTPSMAQWRTPPAWQQSRDSPGVEEERVYFHHRSSAAIILQHSSRRGRAEQWARIVLPAAAGSAVGGLAGAYAGGYLMEEGLDAGYAGSILGVVGGGGIGSILGSAGAATVMGTSDYPVSFTRAAAGAAVGMIPAYLLVATVADQSSTLGTFALYGVVQGAIVAAVAVGGVRSR
jgi:hypothetical protein